MARSLLASLAIASLFAPCCWCSAERQGLEDTRDVEEVTTEAEVALLQVEVKVMPRLHAASSDKLSSMGANPSAAVAFSLALGSTGASPPSAPVLFACLLMGVAAAGLTSIVLIREIYLHWWRSTVAGSISARFMQVSTVSKTLLSAAKYAAFIPLALDLAGEVGWSPALSSMFIGGINAGRFMGNVLARVLQPKLCHSLARQVAIAAMALTAVLEVLACMPILLQPASWVHGYLIFGVRFLSGLLSGIAAMADVIVRKCMPEKEHTPLSLSNGIAVSVGMLIGPLLSTSVLTCLGQQRYSMEASDKLAGVTLVCAILTAGTSIISSLSLPTRIDGAKDHACTEAAGDENCEAQDVATSKSSIQKEAFTLAAALPSLVVCGLSIVSIEVATSMLLEVEFGWSPKAVGYATAAGLGPTGLLSFTCILLTEFEVVREGSIVGFLLIMAVAGVALLSENNLIDFGAVQLLCSDFLLYPSASVLSSIVSGKVFTIASKGSALISVESAQMVVTVASEGLDLISVVTARMLLAAVGRNGYAMSQAALVAMMFLALHGPFSEGGSEATKDGALAGNESAPEASADGTGTGTAAARLLEGPAK